MQGDGGFAPGVAVGEILDHRLAEALLAVEHVMRDAQVVGDAAGIVNVLPGAAGALPRGGGAVVVQLEGGADDLMPLLHQQRGDHAAVHAAGHGDQDAHQAMSSPCCQKRLSSCAAMRKSRARVAKRASPPWLSPSASSRAAAARAIAW